MGISKTEVNLRRLLAAAPNQQNRAKLIHYVATLREQLEQLAEERTDEGLPRLSKAKLNDYSEKIEAIASTIASPMPNMQVSEMPVGRNSFDNTHVDKKAETNNSSPPGLRRRYVPASGSKDQVYDTGEGDMGAPVKLDSAAQEHIEKHRKLQEDLTDEMVVLARQLKESSLMMSQSVQNTEKSQHRIRFRWMASGCMSIGVNSNVTDLELVAGVTGSTKVLVEKLGGCPYYRLSHNVGTIGTTK